MPDVVIDGGTTKSVPWKPRVAGNGNSPARETPVAPWAGQLLRYWLDVRVEHGVPRVMAFPSTKSTGKPWGKVARYNAAKEVLQAAGVDDIEGGSFRLRHTFALRQLRRGKAADEVARWLGVSDPAVITVPTGDFIAGGRDLMAPAYDFIDQGPRPAGPLPTIRRILLDLGHVLQPEAPGTSVGPLELCECDQPIRWTDDQGR